MHELSIAINIVEIAREEAEKARAKSVSKLVLEIGKMSGVMPEALEMAMQEAIQTTLLQNTDIQYNYVDAIASCTDCCHEFLMEDMLAPCPVCNSNKTYLIKGKELYIKSMEIIN